MISSRHIAEIEAELEPDRTMQHEPLNFAPNAIGDHYRWWSSLTPHEQEKFKQKEKEFKTKRYE